MNYKPTITLERLNKHMSINVSQDCIDDIKEILELLDNLSLSKKTRYHKLDDFTSPLNDLLRKKLESHGFINGDKKANDKKPNVMLL